MCGVTTMDNIWNKKKAITVEAIEVVEKVKKDFAL